MFYLVGLFYIGLNSKVILKLTFIHLFKNNICYGYLLYICYCYNTLTFSQNTKMKQLQHFLQILFAACVLFNTVVIQAQTISLNDTLTNISICNATLLDDGGSGNYMPGPTAASPSRSARAASSARAPRSRCCRSARGWPRA